MDEAQQLPRLIAGDARAWDQLVRAHAPVMHAMVARQLGRAVDDGSIVEDVVQRVFLKLWEDDRRRLRTFRGGARLGTWLVAIARREAIDELRGRERRTRHAAVLETRTREQVEPPAGPDAVSAAREDAERMHEALAAIPPRDRLLVTWIEEGWTYRAIARVLSLRENSIGPLLRRARERLGRALNGTPSASMYGSATGTPPTERSERP